MRMMLMMRGPAIAMMTVLPHATTTAPRRQVQPIATTIRRWHTVGHGRRRSRRPPPLERPRRILSMQSLPNPCKKCLLTPKFHLGPFFIVRSPQLFQRLLNFGRTLATAHHVVVQHIESLGGIRQCLDARRKEPTGAVTAKAVPTGQSGKAWRETLAFPQSIGFRKDTRLHLA